jgi:GTPase SAR1 family protein
MQKEQVLTLLEELGLYDPVSSGIYVLYGQAAAGKTTLMARAAEEASRDDVPTFYLMVEPNLRLYRQADKIMQMLPPRVRCGGREMEAAAHYDAPLPLFHRFIEITSTCERAFVVVDSITALAQHEQARYLAAVGRLDVLPIVRSMSAFANAMTQLLANNIADRYVSIYYIAQERPTIGQAYYGEPAAPSFAMRAQHNVAAAARLYTTADRKRLIKVVWHRVARYAGAVREVQIEPLL